MGGAGRSCWRRRWLAAVVVLAVVFAVAAVAAAGRPIRAPATAHVTRPSQYSSSTSSWMQMLARRSSASPVSEDATTPAFRRRLFGPGSSPPTCRSRCGRCTPCRPVRVAIQPGVGAQWEYYPEVWRCKCGSKLFMP